MAGNQNKNKYTSPLDDELNLSPKIIGEGVLAHYDKQNGRLLMDIDVRTRRGITSSGKSIKIATATYMIQDKKKISLNVFDKEMNDKELDMLDAFLTRKAKRSELDAKLKAMK